MIKVTDDNDSYLNFIYLRVSKTNEEFQDPKQQLPLIKKRFKDEFSSKKPKILIDRGSAYDMDKINKRIEFLNILDMCFDAKTTTIEDLFLGNIKKKKIKLFVWDYARIIRNIEFNLLFSILNSVFDVKLYSFKDNSVLPRLKNEKPLYKMARLMMDTISANNSEQYSYEISENTKKSYLDGGFSTKGNKWGRKFKSLNGDNFKFKDESEYVLFKKDISRKVKLNWSGKQIIDYIANKYGISISHSYLTKEFRRKKQ